MEDGNENTNEVMEGKKLIYLFTMNTNGVAHISSSQNAWSKWMKCEPDGEADKMVGSEMDFLFF